MRLSVQRGDPGFREDAGDGSWVVLLNGEPQSPQRTGRAVVTADEAEGALWFHPCADDGSILALADFGVPLVERVDGKVSIYRVRSEYLPAR